MRYISIHRLNDYVGQIITLNGWVHTLRDQKQMQFIILRNPTGMVQASLEKQRNPALAEVVSTLTRESAVRLTGHVAQNPDVRLGGVEIQLAELHIENRAKSPLPIEPFGKDLPGLEPRLDWRHLDLRRPENRLLFQVQTTVESAMRDFWQREGFIEIHTPKIMGSASESGAELFELPYFETIAYLAQSPQFYKQMAMAAGLERVFEIGPVFRANPSFTSRHDTEFTSVDVEFSWIESHVDLMDFEEQWLRHTIFAVRQAHGEAIAEHFGSEVTVPDLPFPRITMEEALVRLRERGYTPPPQKQGDLCPHGERLLGENILDDLGHEFVFLVDYPVSVRPFYHMRYPDNPTVTKSFDLLWKGLELTTGAQREHRPDVLAVQAKEKGVRLKPIQYYLDFFKYGCPPHGGFGFGLTRMLMILLGFKNVREVTYLYRGPRRLYP
ncbi:MAG: aspartate--tRNA(Asn) ligase [Gemmatimonadetes bacterium]|nr:aspartate--tRNA(Asn) ligase [Gemmatimonadota bacterium]MDE3256850.1 aspartate--tRNA(Asn) ligase [Gemmatimonadota bacterium]